MTKHAQSLLARIGAAAAALTAVAGVIYWLLDTEFVSAEELAPVVADVRTLKSDLRDLQIEIELSTCLQLADLRNTSWLECVRRHDASK